MTLGLLRQRVGMKQAELDKILAKLEEDSRIRRAIDVNGEMVSLKD